MIRTSFEFKIAASTYEEALRTAQDYVSTFLALDPSELEDVVDLEFKVSLPKAETAAEIAESMDQKMLVVTVFGSVKRSISKPFGHQ